MSPADFTVIAAFLKQRSGLIITADKQYLLESRLSAMMRELGLADLTAVAERLRQTGADPLKDRVVDAMTTNETSFFRDAHPFEALRKTVIPGLIQRRERARSLRIWSAACSTGQEPYSLAMLLKENFPLLAGWKVEILATDISPTALARARQGTYSTFEVQRGMPIQMLIRHFSQIGDTWRINDELRRPIVFQPINLLGELSQLGAFDIVLCRNVLIYFDAPTKTRILNGIAGRLAADGALLLGGAESVFSICDAFTGLPGLKGVYGHTKSSTRAPWPRQSLPAAS
jgi:chemotaxis protein methyltransferase CheR